MMKKKSVIDLQSARDTASQAPAGRRRGSASVVSALKRLTTRADAEAVAHKLLALAKGGDLRATRLLLDRLDGPLNGPLAITMAQAMNVTQQDSSLLREEMAKIPTATLIAHIRRTAAELGEPPPLPLLFPAETQPPTPPPLLEARPVAEPEHTPEQPDDPPPRGVLSAAEFLK